MCAANHLLAIREFVYFFIVGGRIEFQNLIANSVISVGFIEFSCVGEYIGILPKPLRCTKCRRIPAVFLALSVRFTVRAANCEVKAHLEFSQS